MTDCAFQTPKSLGTRGCDELWLQGPELPFGLQETGLVHSYHRNYDCNDYFPISSESPRLFMLSGIIISITQVWNGKLNDPEYGIFTGPGRVEVEIA